LPAAPANFTGRSAELEALERLAAGYDPARRLALVVVVGVGGLGKTALVSHWLHGVSARYDGGALFTDLKGHLLQDVARPDDVLAGFLRALGVAPERIPLDLNEQSAMFRSATSGRRMIVFLDNAASAAQVRVLLPGPGPESAAEGEPARAAEQGSRQLERASLVVVTTRWRISGLAMDGARFLELGPLDDDAAAELLDRMVGAERTAEEADAARSVVELCGGLPLAICVIGARLAAHPRWPVSRIAEQLASGRDRLAALSLSGDVSVRAAFDVSYQGLSADAAHAYRLVALIPGPDFGPELAAAAIGQAGDRTGGLLDALADASLLTETAQSRYRFHDLARLHASEQADAEPAAERLAVIARSVDWYLHEAVAADIVVIPGRWRLNPMYEQASQSPPAYGGPAEALEWLELELPGLLAAVEAAHREGMHEQAWQLCEALWGLFAYRKYFRSWIDAHFLGLASAQASGNSRGEARMRVQLGLAYMQLGQLGDAREEYSQALALDRRAGHRIGEATELEQLGLTELAEDRPDEAIELFAKAHALFRQIGEDRGAAMMTCHMGEAHSDAGRYGEAVSALTEARGQFAALLDHYNYARALTGIGQARVHAGQPGDAIPPLTEALTVMIRLDVPYEQARIRVALAGAVQQLGDLQQARAHLEQALAIYSAIEAPEADEVWRRLGDSEPGDGIYPGRAPL
jgi:tetratricopeptide (TPR) repeat protein